jgi:hypothetical protein
MTDYDVVAAMDAFGGGFARAIAAAWYKADPENQATLKAAFPGLWVEYTELPELRKAKA